MTDPVASSTLAALYIAQGHERKAARVLKAVLDDDPFDGAALELSRRLEGPALASLTVDVDETSIALSWTCSVEHADTDESSEQLHVVLIRYADNGHGFNARVDSVRCDGPRGRWKVARPRSGGSAVATLGRVTARGFTPVAIARPVAWTLDLSFASAD